ncbi:MAG: cysteine desulfurase [Luteimonas sp.]
MSTSPTGAPGAEARDDRAADHGARAAAPSAVASNAPPGAVDWGRVRADFPLLQQREVHGKPLIYFDSANTGQKPAAVIDAVDDFYRRRNANVSRAVHQLGSEATDAYEGARGKLARFLNVQPADLVLCSGTTFAINLVAYSWALPRLKSGDAILVTRMEHHANIVPWQLVAERSGATIRVAELLADGTLDGDALYAAMTPDVKLLAIAHVSNVLGTVNPLREICREARRRGIVTVVDGSQAVPHRRVDIAAIGCDFYALTGHKMCGPTGTGALWARREHLTAMPPFIGGGEMIAEVSFDGTVYNDPPYKFEAGTPNIAGFVGLGAAVDYLQSVGMDRIEAQERELLAHLTEALTTIDGLRIFGSAPDKAAVVSFVVDGAHAHDLATLLDLEGVAIRSGQHCAHPLLQWFGVAATCRASLAFYNTHDEIDRFVAALHKVRKLLL